MRSRSLLDLSAPSNHRLVLPPHLAQFIASLPQRSAAAANGGSGGLDGSSPGSALPLSAHASNAQNNLHSRLQQHRTIFTPSLHPPITRHTLRELDLCEILKNPQLRHDVVFDPNVQFRPNFDGERGRRKREAGDRYWAAVVREIEHGCTCTSSDGRNVLPCSCPETAGRGRKIVTPSAATFSRASGRAGNGPIHHAPSIRIPSRIPLLVQELRAICLSILPSHFPSDTTGQPSPSSPSSSPTSASGAGESANKAPAVGTSALYANPPWAASHHALIAQTLDPHLIAQELQHRVLDVPALVTFMGSILKLHCAPMRDEAIERMVEVVCVDGDVGKGLRMCFEILELMKLVSASRSVKL